MNYLYLFQFACMTTMLLMTAILIVARFFLRHTENNYEYSRWLLVLSALLLATHYFLQMHYGFREQSDDLGAIVNFLFYLPAQLIFGYCQLRMISSATIRRRYLRIGSICYLLLVLGIGLAFYLHGSPQLGHERYLFFAALLATEYPLLRIPYVETRAIKHRLSHGVASAHDSYLTYLYSGSTILLSMAILLPVMIVSRTILYILGPVFIMAILIYVVSFIAMGFCLAPIMELIEKEEQTKQIALQAELQNTTTRVNIWLQSGTYLHADMTVSQALDEMQLTQKQLNRYIKEVSHIDSYRRWLSHIRIEAAKELLIKHPDYTIEAIAEMCGFSDRSNFTRAFKAQTGCAPGRWIEENVEKHTK